MPRRIAALSIAALLLACSEGGVRRLPDAGAPTCGDGRADPGEECDGSDLRGSSCTRLGFDLGTVSCDGQCRIVTSACVKPCGNGRIDPGEACDATAGALVCATWGYKTCTASCTVDTLHCRSDAFQLGIPVKQRFGGPAIVADLAPPGRGELVIPDANPARLQLYEYELFRGFSSRSPISSPSGVPPSVPIAADLNGDGRIDLGAINTDGSADRYLYVPPGEALPDGGAPSPSGEYAVQHLLDAPGAGTPCALVEWIGAFRGQTDGSSDLAALACPSSTSPLTFEGVIVHRGGRVPAAAGWVPHAQTVAAALADFDGDGTADLLLAQQDGNLAVRAGPGFDSPSTPVSLGTMALRIAAGDLDGDGDADVVISTAGALKILENMGTRLEERPSLPVSAFAVAVRDLDLDGHADVVWLGGNTVEVLRNAGGFTFDAHPEPTGPGTPLSLAVGDFEGDGDMDIAATVLDSPGGTATTTHVLENLVR